MKNNKTKYIWLIIIPIIVIILIVLLIVFSTSTNRLYGNWEAYQTEVVQDEKLLHTMEIYNIDMKIDEDKIVLCHKEEGKKICENINYEYDNDTLNVLDDNAYLYGNYIVKFEKVYLILERMENKETNMVIKQYFERVDNN